MSSSLGQVGRSQIEGNCGQCGIARISMSCDLDMLRVVPVIGCITGILILQSLCTVTCHVVTATLCRHSGVISRLCRRQI